VTLNRGQTYRCHAYVCSNACVQMVDNMGTVTFTWLFLHRPIDCRYAVVSTWDEQVLVFDLFETQENLRNTALIPPDPTWVGGDVDAAIMAAQLGYRDD
jgi:hypothetical protein